MDFKKGLSSQRALRGILTKGSILALVFALALMAKGLKLDSDLYLSLFTSILILSETYSIFGNVYSIKTKKEVEEFDAVAMAIKSARLAIARFFILKRDEL